jgi:hypothetical protein
VVDPHPRPAPEGHSLAPPIHVALECAPARRAEVPLAAIGIIEDGIHALDAVRLEIADPGPGQPGAVAGFDVGDHGALVQPRVAELPNVVVERIPRVEPDVEAPPVRVPARDDREQGQSHQQPMATAAETPGAAHPTQHHAGSEQQRPRRCDCGSNEFHDHALGRGPAPGRGTVGRRGQGQHQRQSANHREKTGSSLPGEPAGIAPAHCR